MHENYEWFFSRAMQARKKRIAVTLSYQEHVVWFGRAANGGAGILEEPWVWYVKCQKCGKVRKYDAKLDVMEDWGQENCHEEKLYWTDSGKLILDNQ